MITIDNIIVFVGLAFLLVSLYLGIFGPAFTFLITIIFFLLTDVIEPKESLAGFANDQVAVVLMLLLFGDIIRKTTIIEKVFDRLFIYAKSYNGFLFRMMLIVAGFSSMLNNTPIVAVMMPYVHNWCKKNNYSPSKFLIPLSYAAILGGSTTLIGTSTNLIVNSMVKEQNLVDNLKPLEMFDFIWVGVPMMVLGFIYLITVGHRLLPAGKGLLKPKYHSGSRLYFIETRIREKSKYIGKTANDAELINYKGLLLVEIIRNNKSQADFENLFLEEEDKLIYAGDHSEIATFIDTAEGLVISEMGMFAKRKKTKVIEIVVSQNSSLIGRKLGDINFRLKYDATVLAFHRNGEQIPTNKAEINIRAGDVLLVLGGSAFENITHNTQDFYFISQSKDSVKVENYKIYILLFGLVAAIVLSMIDFFDFQLYIGLTVLIALTILLKVANPKDIARAIDFNLAFIIVMSLALGTAMINTGTADLIANGFLRIFLPFGAVGALLGLYLITTVLAAFITNKASVGIIFPIAITVAEHLGVSYTPFLLTVAYASAANFMTPIGYQTNLMVYGPGGYTFRDFFRVGTPLTFIYMIVTVTILSLIYF